MTATETIPEKIARLRRPLGDGAYDWPTGSLHPYKGGYVELYEVAGVRTFDPATNREQAMVLLEELLEHYEWLSLSKRHLLPTMPTYKVGHRVTRAVRWGEGPNREQWVFDLPILTAICLAWIAWKENGS